MNAQLVNPYPGVPPQLQEILDSNPQLDGMKEPLPNFPPERRTLNPESPPATSESPFVLMYVYSDDEFEEYDWTNPPTDISLVSDVGEGQGFERIKNKQVIKEPGNRPKNRPDLFAFSSWHVASRRFVDVVTKFDAEAFTTMPIEWQFDDVTANDYVFFDASRLVDAYDYRRSVLEIAFKNGRRILKNLKYPRALKHGAGDHYHIFRDFYRRNEIFVSRELATALVDSGMRGLRFKDLATGQTLDLAHIEFRE